MEDTTVLGKDRHSRNHIERNKSLRPQKIQSYRAGAKVGTMLNITVEDLIKRAK